MNKSFDTQRSCVVIVGGDKRMAYMGEVLKHNGYAVLSYGADKGGVCPDMEEAASLEAALQQAGIVIGPIPLAADGRFVTGNCAGHSVAITDLETYLTESHQFFAGCIPGRLRETGARRHIAMYDYMEQEELTIFNTIATAEGAIAEAIRHNPENLHGSCVLVTGYGRCARTLADKLRGLVAQVDICARDPVARAAAQTAGLQAVDFHQLPGRIEKYDYIFNTVPEPVLNRQVLDGVKKSALIIDIASAPGGTDFDAAAKAGIQARLCPGLPGIYAPAASGAAIAEVTMKIMKNSVQECI